MCNVGCVVGLLYLEGETKGHSRGSEEDEGLVDANGCGRGTGVRNGRGGGGGRGEGGRSSLLDGGHTSRGGGDAL